MPLKIIYECSQCGTLHELVPSSAIQDFHRVCHVCDSERCRDCTIKCELCWGLTCPACLVSLEAAQLHGVLALCKNCVSIMVRS